MPVHSNNNASIRPFPQVDKTLHGLRIRNTSAADIPQLVALHMQHFDPSEFSILLGQEVVQQFYDYAVSSPCASLLVAVEGEKVFGFSLAFQAYEQFLAGFKSRALFAVFKRLTSLALGLRWISLKQVAQHLVVSDLYSPPAEVKNYHLGVIILDPEHAKSPQHILVFSEAFKVNIGLVKAANAGGCWTSVAKHNKKSLRIVKALLKPDEQYNMRDIPTASWCFVCHKAG